MSEEMWSLKTSVGIGSSMPTLTTCGVAGHLVADVLGEQQDDASLNVDANLQPVVGPIG